MLRYTENCKPYTYHVCYFSDESFALQDDHRWKLRSLYVLNVSSDPRQRSPRFLAPIASPVLAWLPLFSRPKLVVPNLYLRLDKCLAIFYLPPTQIACLLSKDSTVRLPMLLPPPRTCAFGCVRDLVWQRSTPCVVSVGQLRCRRELNPTSPPAGRRLWVPLSAVRLGYVQTAAMLQAGDWRRGSWPTRWLVA